MSDMEILEKAIQKAIDGGWDRRYRKTYLWSVSELAEYLDSRDEAPLLIFNHDFAKALWGEELTDCITGSKLGELSAPMHPVVKHFEYHLQQMVIADDPIKYLGENL